MTVYKYKSLGDTRCALEHEKLLGYLKDICLNNRLYAADFNQLDDPMEGVFESYNDENSDIVKQIYYGKSNTYICSLSPTYRSMLMWSFYANYHKGCCVEVEIDNSKLRKVDYQNNPMSIDNLNLGGKEKILTILSRKYKDWAFEKEYRVLSEEHFVKVKVKKIYLGMRIAQEIADKVKFQLLNTDIQIEMMNESMFEHIDTSNINQI